MLKRIKNRFNNAVNGTVIKVRSAVASKTGEGYVDTGVKILIAVVLGALVLTLLYSLLNSTVMPKVVEKVTSMFSYTA